MAGEVSNVVGVDSAGSEGAADSVADAAGDIDPAVSGDGGVRSTKAAAEGDETPPAKAKTKRQFKLYGKDVEKDMDDDEYHATAQKGMAFNKLKEESDKAVAKERAEAKKDRDEAAKVRKEAEEALKALTDPRRAKEILKALGVDSNAHAKEWLKEYIEEKELEQKDPEKLELLRAKRELDKMKADHEERTKLEEAKAHEAEVQTEMVNLGKRVSGALKKAGFEDFQGDEVNETVKRLVFKMMVATQNGDDISDDEMVESLKDEYRKEHTRLYKSAQGKDLYEMLGEEGVKKVNAYALSLSKPTATVGSRGQGPAEKKGNLSFKNADERRAYMEKLAEVAREEEDARERLAR
jgi:hypothetical protein